MVIMKETFEWLSAAANAIVVGTFLVGASIYGRAQIRRYREKQRLKRAGRRLADEAYARLFADGRASATLTRLPSIAPGPRWPAPTLSRPPRSGRPRRRPRQTAAPLE